MIETVKKLKGRPVAKINWPETERFTVNEVMALNSVSRTCVQHHINREIKNGRFLRIEAIDLKKTPIVYLRKNA